MDAAFLTKPEKLRQLFRVARWIAPSIASLLIGWGAVQFTQGRNSNRLDNVETKVEHALTREEFQTWANEQRETLRDTKKQTEALVTREEFRIFAEQQNDRLRELKEDLRHR